MRRWWVTLALLVSLGVNLGLLAAVAAGRWAEERRDLAEPPATVGLPGVGGELPAPTSVVVPRDDDGAGVAGVGSGQRPEGGGETVDPGRATHGEPGDRRRAGRHRGGGPLAGRGGEPPVGRLADHLGLSGERRERFVALQRHFVTVQLAARGERSRLSAELRGELLEPQPDAARIDQILSRLGEVYLASERATAEVILESRDLLDADQQRVYFGFLEHLRGPGRHMGGPGPGATDPRRR